LCCTRIFNRDVIGRVIPELRLTPMFAGSFFAPRRQNIRRVSRYMTQLLPCDRAYCCIVRSLWLEFKFYS